MQSTDPGAPTSQQQQYQQYTNNSPPEQPQQQSPQPQSHLQQQQQHQYYNNKYQSADPTNTQGKWETAKAWMIGWRGSRRLVLVIVAIALLLDNMLLTVVGNCLKQFSIYNFLQLLPLLSLTLIFNHKYLSYSSFV